MQINANQIVSNQVPKFTISKVEVFNVPKQARLGRSLDGNGKPVYNATNTDDYLTEMGVSSTDKPSDYYYYCNKGDDAQPFIIDQFNKKTIYHSSSATTDDVIEFGFYMPEHKVTPNNITYPENIDEEFKQYYKPKGVGEARNGDGTTSAAKIATFVRIHGSYTDHNGQIIGVKYDIYLGQDNTDDFTVKRNQLLNNKLIITGLTNHKDAYPDVVGNISIDHRVEIDDRGYNLSMERTAILDSHFEVRPLDIELSPNSLMTITIPEECRGWIAMENDEEARSGTKSELYVNTIKPRKGVRKYFTTNLVSELDSANNGTITLSNNVSGATTVKTFRIWFYIDENPNVYDKTGATTPYQDTDGTYTVSKEQYRICPVKFKYMGTDKDGNTLVKNATVNFQQWNLWRVWSADVNRYYDIEHEEEYLNNYASDAQYGQTQNGMAWGLEGIQLSNKYRSIIASQEGTSITSLVAGLYTSITDMANDALGGEIHYDFYLTRDFADIQLTTDQQKELTIRDYSGHTYNEEIASTLRAERNDKAKIDGIILTEDPQSAFAYCYHKNKRNANGVVEKQKWFLPAIDEIEDIAAGAYDEFDQVFQNQKYWSCQPVADKESLKAKLVGKLNWGTTYLLADYYVDNQTRARATSIYISYQNGVAKPNNISSGVPGYSAKREGNANGQYGGFLGLELQSFKFDLTRTALTITNEQYANHPGNLPRTDKCRIRAVYRSGAK